MPLTLSPVRGPAFPLRRALLLGVLLSAVLTGRAGAGDDPLAHPLIPDEGKLPLTAGFTDIDGAGGGGLVPWATITGYGTADSWGANAHYTIVPLPDFRLRSYGIAVGGLDRFEVSATQDQFDVKGTALNGVTVEQRIYGLKVRLTGDAVYDQDSWAPQTAVGAEYKRNSGISDGGGVVDPRQLGAQADSSTDIYLSATKVFLAQSLLADVNIRYTNANQLGLLGFGGDLKRRRSVNFEGTLAYLLMRTLAVGAEYRQMPHNLGVDDERAAWDAFVAWTASPHVSLVAAFVSLGSILGPATHQSRDQNGAYISLQVGF
jgi:hypothetical protein